MTIEEAIEYLDFHFYSDDCIADHDAVKAYETLKAFITSPNDSYLKLTVPKCCKECSSARFSYHTDKNKQWWSCGMADARYNFVNPDTIPDWCPIVKTNETLDQMPAEKRKQFDSIARGLRAIFGDDKSFDQA